MTSSPLITLNLFGAFQCCDSDGALIDIRSAKQRALLAMLAVAAKGVHSRSWLQEHLWERSGEEHGRASLRRALTDMRKVFGPRFYALFEISNTEIQLRHGQIKLASGRQAGEFLEGIRIREPKFNAWLAQHRKQSQPSFAANTEERLDLAPSVAILPITSVHGTAEESHFGDLVAAEVARCLSRSRMVDVISHLSSRQLQRPMLEISTVKAELGVIPRVFEHPKKCLTF